ncbi:MAG: type II secretion system F family protein [Candidatus Omnitrophica bacterium]|nr:type II secretion system F family protein [Candidatus Omnitrophota bacterium]
MAQLFRFQAKNSQGEIVEGTLQAETESQAYQQLTEQNYFPMLIEPAKPEPGPKGDSLLKKLRFFSSHKVSSRELARAFDHFSVLIRSGFPILKCIELIQKQIQSPVLINSFEQIAKDVEGGTKLSDSISNFPTVFPATVVGAIQAGEASGKLDYVFSELSRSFESEADLRAKIGAALVYPVFVMLFGIFTVFFVLTFIVPKLIVFFETWDHPLPLPTRILLGISSLLTHGLGVVLIVFFVALVLFWRRLSREKKMSILTSTTKVVPFFQSVLFLVDFVPLARTWSLLLRSGVPILESMRIVESVVSNLHLRKSLKQVSERVMQGSRLSESLYEAKVFPDLALSFVSVGEESGGLDVSFERIAQFYERELDQKLKVITTLLEPILILFVGLGICFIVLSLLLPIFEINMLAQ